MVNPTLYSLKKERVKAWMRYDADISYNDRGYITILCNIKYGDISAKK